MKRLKPPPLQFNIETFGLHKIAAMYRRQTRHTQKRLARRFSVLAISGGTTFPQPVLVCAGHHRHEPEHGQLAGWPGAQSM